MKADTFVLMGVLGIWLGITACITSTTEGTEGTKRTEATNAPGLENSYQVEAPPTNAVALSVATNPPPVQAPEAPAVTNAPVSAPAAPAAPGAPPEVCGKFEAAFQTNWVEVPVPRVGLNGVVTRIEMGIVFSNLSAVIQWRDGPKTAVLESSIVLFTERIKKD